MGGVSAAYFSKGGSSWPGIVSQKGTLTYEKCIRIRHGFLHPIVLVTARKLANGGATFGLCGVQWLPLLRRKTKDASVGSSSGKACPAAAPLRIHAEAIAWRFAKGFPHRPESVAKRKTLESPAKNPFFSCKQKSVTFICRVASSPGGLLGVISLPAAYLAFCFVRRCLRGGKIHLS